MQSLSSEPARPTLDIKPPFSGDFMIRLRVLTNLGSDYNVKKSW